METSPRPSPSAAAVPQSFSPTAGNEKNSVTQAYAKAGQKTVPSAFQSTARVKKNGARRASKPAQEALMVLPAKPRTPLRNSATTSVSKTNHQTSSFRLLPSFLRQKNQSAKSSQAMPAQAQIQDGSKVQQSSSLPAIQTKDSTQAEVVELELVKKDIELLPERAESVCSSVSSDDDMEFKMALRRLRRKEQIACELAVRPLREDFTVRTAKTVTANKEEKVEDKNCAASPQAKADALEEDQAGIDDCDDDQVRIETDHRGRPIAEPTEADDKTEVNDEKVDLLSSVIGVSGDEAIQHVSQRMLVAQESLGNLKRQISSLDLSNEDVKGDPTPTEEKKDEVEQSEAIKERDFLSQMIGVSGEDALKHISSTMLVAQESFHGMQEDFFLDKVEKCSKEKSGKLAEKVDYSADGEESTGEEPLVGADVDDVESKASHESMEDEEASVEGVESLDDAESEASEEFTEDEEASIEGEDSLGDAESEASHESMEDDEDHEVEESHELSDSQIEVKSAENEQTAKQAETNAIEEDMYVQRIESKSNDTEQVVNKEMAARQVRTAPSGGKESVSPSLEQELQSTVLTDSEDDNDVLTNMWKDFNMDRIAESINPFATLSSNHSLWGDIQRKGKKKPRSQLFRKKPAARITGKQTVVNLTHPPSPRQLQDEKSVEESSSDIDEVSLDDTTMDNNSAGCNDSDDSSCGSSEGGALFYDSHTVA
mmetsp:Transcript_21609/g.45100  ORF Transcript_21609/g.45100 Transcript_21609/m.45100 type:complete len:714 (-) Transcript_21609:93-2234(-)